MTWPTHCDLSAQLHDMMEFLVQAALLACLQSGTTPNACNHGQMHVSIASQAESHTYKGEGGGATLNFSGTLQYTETARQLAISAADACISTGYTYLKCLTPVVSRATPYLLQQSTAS